MPKDKKHVGHPPKFDTPEKLEKRIEEYFKKGMALKKVIIGPSNNRKVALIPVPTITGLVLYCGYCNRVSFYNLEKMPLFSNTIKKARTKIEQHYEELLQTGLGAGAIFALKNFGWIDKTPETENPLANEELETIPEKEFLPENRLKQFLN